MIEDVDIELLIVPDCPHWATAAELIKTALNDLGMTGVNVRTTVIDTAEEAHRRGFTGSPTILLDDRDLFPPLSPKPALACRMYPTKEGPQGAPELSALRRALKEAAEAGTTPRCGCCGRTGRRMAELGVTPGTYICWSCALWALRRAKRPEPELSSR